MFPAYLYPSQHHTLSGAPLQRLCLMRKGEESYQGEGYVNRVNVPGDMLLKGNCSLVMKELRHDDAGVYESYLLVKRPKRALHSERVFIQRIELSVNGTFILCCLQNISTDHKSVSLGENTTLHCNITADYEISWYGQSSDELRLLISAGRTNLDKQFSLSYNVDRDHFDTTDSNGSVTLVIINVTENDLGLYYCRGRDYRSLLKFGRTIRLAITDDGYHGHNTAHFCHDSILHSARPCWITLLILVCVCLVSVPLNIICICVLCCRVQGKPMSSSTHTCCYNSREPTEKEEVLQYARFGHHIVTSEAEGNTVHALDTVTYARVMT